MLSFHAQQPALEPRPAATVMVLRGGQLGAEVLCILRHPQSTFLGGVLAFPGGRVDGDDARVEGGVLAPRTAGLSGPVGARELVVAACRELLEEVAIVPIAGIDHQGAVALRDRLTAGESFGALVAKLPHPLELGALEPFGRWVTPEAESRRYDATFFVLELPAGQQGLSDEHETTAVLWDTPARWLERWQAGEVQMVPPTTRVLELLAGCASVAEVLERAKRQSLLPVCPRFVPDDNGGFLALPGDPAHELSERRVEGPTRFVRRGDRFVSADQE